MSTFTLKQGRHYHQLPPFSTLPWMGKQRMQRTVTFAPDCQYKTDVYHAQDVNKLFGLSFGLRGVHWNSARFGWRWSQEHQCVELLAYCYVEGQRNQDAQLNFPVVAQVELQRPYALDIEYMGGFGINLYSFTVREYADADRAGIQIGVPVGVSAPPHLPSYGLTHGLYWGGETLCPSPMHVTLNRTNR